MKSHQDILQSWLKEDLVITNINASSWEEALNILCSPLKAKGYVADDFCRALIERERKFPTGLPVQGAIKAAIPHVNPEYIIKSGVAIGILDKPVAFGEMGSSDKKVLCKVIFLLALKDSKDHLELLGKLMNLFTDKKSLKVISEETNRAKIIQFLTGQLLKTK